MNDVVATPRSLAGLVEPQTGSVVSRVVFRNAGGTLTTFAFAEGEGLEEHVNPNDALLLVLDGRCAVTIQGEEHEVEAGELLHLPASVPHAVLPGGPFRMLLILLRTAPPARDVA